MPCDTQRTVTLDFKVADRGVLLRALEASGLRAHTGYNLDRIADQIIASGEVRFTGLYMDEARATELAGQLKQAYGREAIKTAAKRYGWQVTESKTNANHFELAKARAY